MTNNERKGIVDVSLESRKFRLEVDTEIVSDQILVQIEDTMEARGTTKADLAKLMQCSSSNVSQILNGDGNFTLSTLVSIADALDCKVDVKLCSSYRTSARYSIDDYNIIDFPSPASEPSRWAA